MALHRLDVAQAKAILWELFPNADQTFTDAQWGDEDEPVELNVVYGYDRKADDGYENVFVNVQDLTADQKLAFESQAKRIPNSSFCREVKGYPGLTRIGWL